MDRSEKINKYLTSVHLKPFHVERSSLGENFNPADLNFDRAAVVTYMKKLAQQSSQNFKRNADAFLTLVNHDNKKLLMKSDKFALTYYFFLKKMTCCCLEIIFAAILSCLIGVIIVLGEYITQSSNLFRRKKQPNFEATTNTLET